MRLFTPKKTRPPAAPPAPTAVVLSFHEEQREFAVELGAALQASAKLETWYQGKDEEDLVVGEAALMQKFGVLTKRAQVCVCIVSLEYMASLECCASFSDALQSKNQLVVTKDAPFRALREAPPSIGNIKVKQYLSNALPDEMIFGDHTTAKQLAFIVKEHVVAALDGQAAAPVPPVPPLPQAAALDVDVSAHVFGANVQI